MMGGVPTRVSGQALKQNASGADEEVQRPICMCGEIASVSVRNLCKPLRW